MVAPWKLWLVFVFFLGATFVNIMLFGLDSALLPQWIMASLVIHQIQSNASRISLAFSLVFYLLTWLLPLIVLKTGW